MDHYKIFVRCTNCGVNILALIPKRTSIEDHECCKCECAYLTRTGIESISYYINEETSHLTKL